MSATEFHEFWRVADVLFSKVDRPNNNKKKRRIMRRLGTNCNACRNCINGKRKKACEARVIVTNNRKDT